MGRNWNIFQHHTLDGMEHYLNGNAVRLIIKRSWIWRVRFFPSESLSAASHAMMFRVVSGSLSVFYAIHTRTHTASNTNFMKCICMYLFPSHLFPEFIRFLVDPFHCCARYATRCCRSQHIGGQRHTRYSISTCVFVCVLCGVDRKMLRTRDMCASDLRAAHPEILREPWF